MHDHAVQFFANDPNRLTVNVARFLNEGLGRGVGVRVPRDEFQLATVHPLLAAHTRVAPSVQPEFNAALERAMDQLWGDERQADGILESAVDLYGSRAHID